jgi:hypothetical protein
MFRRTVADGLELRQFGWDDAEILFAAVERNRDHLRQWLPWVDGTRSTDEIRLFLSRATAQFEDGLGPNFGIWLDGTLIGAVGCHPIDRPTAVAASVTGLRPDIRAAGRSRAVAGTCWTIYLTRRASIASRSVAVPGIRGVAPSRENWVSATRACSGKRSG